MESKWLGRLAQAAMVAITLSAVFQELEKPSEERAWHGKVGFVPYDFRLPTTERLRAAYWNPEEHRIFTPDAFGIGWAINFAALLEKLRILAEPGVTEQDFLMPTPKMKALLAHRSEEVLSPDRPG